MRFEQARDAFDAHLDRCAQCREHPFELCATGAPLLKTVGDTAAEVLISRTNGVHVSCHGEK